MRKQIPLLTAALALGLTAACGASRGEDAAGALKAALEQAGWTARSLPDGGLEVVVPAAPVSTPDEAAAAASVAGSAAPIANWERLGASGWRVERNADGSVLLFPPAAPAAAAGAAQVPTSEGPAQAPPGEVGLMGLAGPLEARGWRVGRGEDGSLLLYPRVDDPAAPTKRPVEACPGEVVTLVREGGISLPVDGPDEARVIAASWLAGVDGPEALVGRIRQVNRMFLVSIVTTAPPHRLLHQIGVNSRTGRVIVLF